MRLSLLPVLAASAIVVAGAVPARSADMHFSTVPYGAEPGCRTECPRLMEARGTITTETPEDFLRFARREINRPGLINVLLIHSPGGSVRASIELGRALRKLGTVVIVARAADAHMPPSVRARGAAGGQGGDMPRFISGTCASACVYALAGGVKRVVPPESHIAVHRMAGNVAAFDFATRDYSNRRVYAGEQEVGTLTNYIASMGVSPELVSIAESIPHEQARVLSAKEMARLRLASPKL